MGDKKQKKKSKRLSGQTASNTTSQTTKVGDDFEGDDKKADAERQRKADLELKIRQRVALEARAFDVVNRLIEPGITTDYLLEACQFIDHNHYGDVVEERSISHLCGYPLCSNALTQVSEKKYHISTKTNTVYDITERKMFCSNLCYQASRHLHKQIPETPVWTRRDIDQSTFSLLQHQSQRPTEGEEVIGFSLFGLKDEVTRLEKLDKKLHSSRATQKPPPSSSVSFEESKRLSDQLLSLSTEEDLENKMGHLSLSGMLEDGGGGGDTLLQKTAGNCPITADVDMPVSDLQPPDMKQAGEGSQSHDSQVRPLERQENTQSENGSCLQSAMEKLSVQDRATESNVDNEVRAAGQNAGDSDDDSDDNVERCDSAISKAKAYEVSPETLDVRHSETPVQQSPKPVTVDSSAGSTETNTRTSSGSLKQQPGESKSAYLMRLLDKRKNLLSTVADIQADPTARTQSSQSQGVSSQPQVVNSENKSTSLQETEVLFQVSSSSKPSSQHFEKTDEGAHAHSASDSVKQDRRKSGKHSCSDQKQLSEKRFHKETEVTSQQVSPVNCVMEVIATWVSLDTLSYLGLTTPADEGDHSDQNMSSDILHKNPEMQRKYQELSQRLAGQEADFEDVLGEEEVGEDERGGKKPLPGFEDLKKQTEKFQVKVQHFLQGPSPVKKNSDKGEGEEAESERLVVLPVIDTHNQLLIRRRIVLERLDRAIPGLLPSLGLSVQDVSVPLRELVFTFSLTSQNIVFKPVEWTLVALILLKMLEIKSQALRTALQSGSRTFNMVLSRLGHTSSSLGQLIQTTLQQCKLDVQDNSVKDNSVTDS